MSVEYSSNDAGSQYAMISVKSDCPDHEHLKLDVRLIARAKGRETLFLDCQLDCGVELDVTAATELRDHLDRWIKTKTLF